MTSEEKDQAIRNAAASLGRLADDLAEVLKGKVTERMLSDEIEVVVRIRKWRRKRRFTDLFEMARRGLDDRDHDTSRARMSATFAKDGWAELRVALPLPVNSEGESQ